MKTEAYLKGLHERMQTELSVRQAHNGTVHSTLTAIGLEYFVL